MVEFFFSLEESAFGVECGLVGLISQIGIRTWVHALHH